MKLLIAFSVAFCLSAQESPVAPPAAGNNVPADRVVVDVGGFKLTKAEFEMLLQSIPEQQRTPNTKKTILDNLASMLQVAGDARAAGFDKQPGQALQMRLTSEQELASAYMGDQMAKLGDEAFLKDWFAKNQSQFSQWKARHILIRMQGSVVPVRKGMKDLTEVEALAKAKAVRAKLAGGADFATVVKADSDDVGSSANGGDLGYFAAGEMAAPVEEAVAKLKVNEISEPVKTEFGYHIIQLLEVRTKPFEEAKEEIAQKSRADLQRKVIETVSKKYPVTVDNEYFGN